MKTATPSAMLALPSRVYSDASTFRLEIDGRLAATLYAVRVRQQTRTVRVAVVRTSNPLLGIDTSPLVLDWACAVLAARFTDARLVPLVVEGVSGYFSPRQHSNDHSLTDAMPAGRVTFSFSSLVPAHRDCGAEASTWTTKVVTC